MPHIYDLFGLLKLHVTCFRNEAEDALTRIERTIARSSERTAVKELANRVVQVIRNQLR